MIHLKYANGDILCGSAYNSDYFVTLVITSTAPSTQRQEDGTYVEFDKETLIRMAMDAVAKRADCPNCLRAYFATKKD